MVKRKVKTDKQYHGQKKRKEKTDKQYHDQKKRKDRQTIPWSKEKKRQTNNTMVTMVLFVCLFFSFDHGIVCLSFLFF
jgi:phosphate/sulfate permease